MACGLMASMIGILMRFGAELRRRWRAWATLGVLIGLFGGAIVAAGAGARRTDSVVSRHIAAHLPPDIFMFPLFSENGELLRFDAIERFPEVVEAHRLPLFFDRDGLEAVGSADIGIFGRANVLEGRLADPTDPHEVTVNFLARERLGFALGETVTLRLAKAGSALDGEFVEGPTVRVRVVGIVASLGDFAGVAEPGANLTPAFVARYSGTAASTDLFAFRLRRGDRDLAAFADRVRDLTGGKPVLYVETRNDWRQIQRSFHVQAFSLWMLAAFLGLVVALIAAQTLARQTFLESSDRPVLAALGMARRQIVSVHAARGAFIGIIAALVTTGSAFALSGLMPFGRPGLAEPQPGFSFGVLPITLGAVAVFLFAVGVSAGAATLERERAASGRPSVIATLAARLVRSAPAAVGVRLALEPGRGSTSVPVRSSLAGSVIGIVATAMAIVVSASLQHMIATPSTYGWAWDAAVGGERFDEVRAQIASLPGIDAISYGNDAAQVDVAGEVVTVMSMAPGPVGPIVLDGRAPHAADEVALGRRTLMAIGHAIGDRVPVAIQGAAAQREMAIVGTVVLPIESDTSTLGEGAFLTLAGMRSLFPAAPDDTAFIRFTPGADRAALVDRLRGLAGEDGVGLPSEPGIVVDFGRVRGMPVLLASVIAMLALATVGHVLIQAVRRRRRDLAILKTLGFVRGQVAAAVAWQACVFALMSLALALPIGISLGRWTWTLLARYGGFVPEVAAPPLTLSMMAAATVILAILISAVPARTAARTQPAQVLRLE